MSNSVQPHRRQPTRLHHPWDFPGKNTGVGCHFLLQCMKVKSEREVAQLCLTLHDPMDCNPPGSSVHGTLQARVLEWVPTAFSVLRGQICKIVYKERLRDIIGNLLKIFKGHSKDSTNEKQSFKIFNKQKSIKFTAHNSFYLFC